MARSEKLDGELTHEADQAAADAALVARARQGDEAAWVALIDEHREPVYRLAYLTLGNGPETAAAAEDIAQETFVRAYRHLDRFADGRLLRPWLLTIAANLARNRRRSVGRYWAAVRRWRRSHQAEQAVTAPTRTARDDARLLWQAIQQLSPDHQQALYLRYFLELSEAEMARVLAVSPGTVKSRLHRARQALKSILRDYFPLLYETWQAN